MRPHERLDAGKSPRTRVESPRTLRAGPGHGAIWIGTDDRQVVIWRDGRVRRLGQKG